jgi:hypothetical protein
MKKRFIFFAFVLFTAANQFVFSQSEVMKFLSLGFNTQQSENSGKYYYEYYFYGFPDYSEAVFGDDSIRLSLGADAFFPPYGRIEHSFVPHQYERYDGKDNSIGYDLYMPTQDFVSYERKWENGKLTFFARGWDRRYGKELIVSEKIEQSSESITIHFGESQYRYYNIPRNELLDKFLTNYVELICATVKLVNTYDFREDSSLYIEPVFQNRTPRELAIFRNCLYAIKGNRFVNSEWTDFFNKYLPDYRAQFSSAEVTAQFTEKEKWLLGLVIQAERKR